MTHIEKWTPFIKKMSKKYANTIASPEDLENEGILGIIKAIKQYDPDKSNLNSFIHQCVSCNIILYSLKNAYPVSCPPSTLLVNNTIKIREQNILTRSIHIESENDPRLTTSNSLDEQVILLDLIEKFDEFGIAKKYLIDGYTCKEIAELLRISCSHVWKTIDRVKKELRKEFGEND